MRTNVVLDDALVKKAFRTSGLKTKREVIHLALKEFVESRQRRNLLDLAGKIEFVEGYDHKKLREGK